MDTALSKLQSCEHRLCVHGLAVQIRCEMPVMNWPIHHALGEFATPVWPEGFVPIPGSIQTYEESVVLRHLSPSAVPVASGDDLVELYEDRERFWLVDDRWGLCQINLLRGEWTSWVLPQPRLSGVEVVDAAVLWPLAQLLQPRGLTLLPAVSLTRSGFGAMIISPFGIEPELSALIDAGWKIIGQRWTGVQDDEGQMAMLRMPGAVERTASGRIRGATDEAISGLVDLTAETPDAMAHHSFCDAVILVDAARRGSVSAKPVRGGGVAAAIRKAWPVFELHGQPRAQNLPARLAAECTVYEAQLSRKAEQFVMAMDKIASMRVPRPARLTPQLIPQQQARPIPA